MKSPPSLGSPLPRLMAVTSSSHELQNLIPSPQFFDVDKPHTEALILVSFILMLLLRLTREFVNILRHLLKLTREFVARGREPIIPPHDAQLQAVVVEANPSSRVSSRIVQTNGIAEAEDALQVEENNIKVE